MLARLFVIFGGLFVLALFAVLVAPYVVDWSSYRADFEREASAMLGRKVIVHGQATAKILPFPSVTFSDVEVAGGPNGEPAMTAETFSMDAELAPLLSGEFRIFDIRLVRPVAIVSVAADGAVDWAMRPSTPIDAAQISIEKMTITEGRIEIRHSGSGRTHRLTEINSELSARSLAGPWRMAGTMRVDGWRSAVTVNTGRAVDGGMRLRVQVEPEVRKVTLETDGDFRFEGASARYSGDFRLSSRKDATTGAVQTVGSGFRVKGRFALNEERFALDEFRFETGPPENPYSADGSGFIAFGGEPRFAVKLDGAQVRFDDALGEGTGGAGLSFQKRLEALQEALLDLPEISMPGSVEVSLPAVVAGDTMIRDVRLSAEPASDGWSVKSMAATLPGRTTLEASGMLSTEGEFGFSGKLLLAIGQPSGFAAWVARDVDDAIRRLPAAGFSADVELTRSRQVFSALELMLGSAVFRGEAERRQPANSAPSTVLKLDGGTVDLDGLAALSSLFVSDAGASRFAEGDLDLDVTAGPVSAAGFVAGSVDASLRLRDGTLEIDRLSIGDVEGATLSATGTLRDFPATLSGNLDASLVAADLAPLIAKAAERYGDNAFVRGLYDRASGYRGLFETARLNLVATSAGNGDGTKGIAVSAQGKVGGAALSATLSAKARDADFSDASVAVTLSGRSDDAGKLLALYGVPVVPLDLVGSGESELSVKGRLSGDLDMSLNFVAGDFSAGFTGTASIADGLALSGRSHINAPDIEPWLMTAGIALPGMGFGFQTELEADLAVSNDVLSLKGISGIINEGSLAGDLDIALDADKPRLTGNVALDELNLEPFAAMVLGETALQSIGSEAGHLPFAPKVSAPFRADVGLSSGTLIAGPSVAAHDATLKLWLDDESLRLTDISATLYDGQVRGLLELKNNSGTGLFSSQLRFENIDLPAALGNVGLSGRSDFSSALSASGKTVGGLVSSLSGSGSAAFRSLVIDGLNADALPQLIARADAIGNDINAQQIAGFAEWVARSGSFAADPFEAAFTVAGGVLRAPPVSLKNAQATLDANVQSDLSAGEVTVNGTITYAPGDEARVGSDPALRFSLKGPLGATAVSFDSQPLAQFLTQRTLELEQERVEGMQEALLERQRLRREVRYYASLQQQHEQAVEEWRRSQEEARKAAEEEAEARRKAAEEARLKAEAEAEQARLAAEEKARLEAERAAEAEARTRARIEAEEQRARQQEDERLRREARERAIQEDAARREAEERAGRDIGYSTPLQVPTEQPRRRPPNNIGAWTDGPPQPKPDGFWEMLTGGAPAN